MHSWSELSTDALADLMSRRGIDPSRPVADPAPFDPVTYRVEQAELALSSMIPARFRNATIIDRGADSWVRVFAADPRTAPSVLLAGEPGVGKTHQAYAMLRAAVLTAARAGRPVTFRATTHPDLNQRLRPATDNSHEHALAPYLDVDLLVLDDLGSGKQTDWTADNLHRLVDHRWSENLATIYTTNAAPEALTVSVGERITSRVFDSTRIVLAGPDRRRP